MAIDKPGAALAELFPYAPLTTTVAQTDIVHVEAGHGRPVVFLHGNPTWSFLWRMVIPQVSSRARCIAPDLPGMGRSGPMPGGGYRFIDYLPIMDAWFDALDLDDVVLVVHDWGSAIGFDWASRNPERVAGIVHMESIALPRNWSDFPSDRAETFKALRGEAGAEAVLRGNVFVERVLPAGMLRKLEPDEHDAYRAPFRESGAQRMPMLVFPRELPIDGEPADVTAKVEHYGAFLAGSAIPKVFINAEPGATVTGRVREFVRTWPNQTEVTVQSIHFIPEDAPQAIASAIDGLLDQIGHG